MPRTLNISELLPDEPISASFHKEEVFNDALREYTILGLMVLGLVSASHVLVLHYRRREPRLRRLPSPLRQAHADDVVNSIAMLVCTVSISVSLGAVLLLPISIVSNEILALHRNSSYVRWINRSFIQGIWNMVFLLSNFCLFIGLPFVYLFTEAEGFPGSKKGIRARVLEACVMLFLLVVLVIGVAVVVAAILGYWRYHSVRHTIEVWGESHLPFLFSLISCSGVLFLLLCSPVGLVQQFSRLKAHIQGGEEPSLPPLSPSPASRSDSEGSPTPATNQAAASARPGGLDVQEDLHLLALQETALRAQLRQLRLTPEQMDYFTQSSPKKMIRKPRKKRRSAKDLSLRVVTNHKLDESLPNGHLANRSVPNDNNRKYSFKMAVSSVIENLANKNYFAGASENLGLARGRVPPRSLSFDYAADDSVIPSFAEFIASQDAQAPASSCPSPSFMGAALYSYLDFSKLFAGLNAIKAKSEDPSQVTRGDPETKSALDDSFVSVASISFADTSVVDGPEAKTTQHDESLTDISFAVENTKKEGGVPLGPRRSPQKASTLAKDLIKRLKTLREDKGRLERVSKQGIIRRCLLYPCGVLLLVLITAVVLVLVLVNTLQLIAGVRALPITIEGGPRPDVDGMLLGRRAVLVWALGPLGAVLEVVLVFYLGAASLVGCYSLGPIAPLAPRAHNTPIHHLIFNSALILVLASALPLLTSTLGLTNFDLLGDYAKVSWLGQFWIVLAYNVMFASATVWCLVMQFTRAFREELYARLTQAAAAFRGRR